MARQESSWLESLKPRDWIAGMTILGLLVSICLGYDGTLTGILAGVIAAYIGLDKIRERKEP